jgi:hypothetical protein
LTSEVASPSSCPSGSCRSPRRCGRRALCPLARRATCRTR